MKPKICLEKLSLLAVFLSCLLPRISWGNPNGDTLSTAFLPVLLTCNNAINPLGIGAGTPQFGWEIKTSIKNFRQSAYQIWVAESEEQLNAEQGNTWNSGKIVTAQSAGVLYHGVTLQSRRRYFWKVKIWDAAKGNAVVSEVNLFEMGLLQESDWKAGWTGFPSGWIGKVHYFRRVFSLAKEVVRARAYVAGIGYYEMEINGKRVGDHVLDPATSDFHRRVYYSTYDIKGWLTRENVVVIAVAPGWYGMPKLKMQMEFQFADGTQEIFSSDDIRYITLGPVVSSGILDGELYDARLEKPEWTLPSDTIMKGIPNRSWGVALFVEPPGGKMTAQELEPIKVVESMTPTAIANPRTGVYVMDAGQNMAGWVRIKVKGQAGTKVTLKFAETLYEDGTVNQENLRTATATDQYILKGSADDEEWEPRFTYHGFRYMQIEGWPGTPQTQDFLVRRVRSAVEAAGTFSCSNELLNRINLMVQRTEASNLHSVPTDCPQRDERMGWLNDLTVRIEQAIYNFNLHRFYSKFINDICDTQDEEGKIADTAPFRWGRRPADPVSASFLLLALKSYEYYGNSEIIKQHYEQMKAWVDYLLTRTNKDGLVDYSYYGDWSPPAAFGREGEASALSVNTPGQLMSTGYLLYCARMIAQMAEVVGNPDDKANYEAIASKTLKTFNDKFWDEQKGGYAANNQSCNSFALFLGAARKDRIPRVVDNLIKNVQLYDYHLTTGNLCTKYLLETLTENGQVDMAYKIATQQTYPSWGYMLAKGATTLWERWEYKTGGSMNSHNHPMMGSVGSWLYKYILGILPDIHHPGFDRFMIKPYIPSDLQFAKGEYKSVKGLIRSAWKKKKGYLEFSITVPANSIATVYIPAVNLQDLTESNAKISRNKQIRFLRMEGDAAVVEVGSGDYSFRSKLK